MTNALERAYASNANTPLLTLEFLHSSLTGGALRLVKAYSDITATLEDSTSVTFTSAGIILDLPERSTDGRQDLQIGLDNTNNLVWQQIKAVVVANRTSESPVICKLRPYLPNDLTAPAGGTYSLTVNSSSINRVSASVIAAYTPIPDTRYPRYRYYPTTYAGVKYV